MTRKISSKLSGIAASVFACALALASGFGCGGSDSSNGDDPCGGKCKSNEVCDMGQCVQCTDHTHCAMISSSRPYCRLSDNICVQCTDSAQCGGQVCSNYVCQTGTTEPPAPECSEANGDADCKGTDVCISGSCRTCRIGTCSLDGTARCASATIGGPTYWDPCSSGVCEQGSCSGDVQECTPGRCYSSSAKCTESGKIFQCSGNTPVCQDNSCIPSGGGASGISAARAALDGVASRTAVPVNIPISGALVTYVRQDSSGFFIQQGRLGPAIFVEKSGGSGSPSAGDTISLTATEVMLNEVRRITAYTGYSRTASGTNVSSYMQDLSRAADITSLQTYESELIELSTTLTTDFDSLGSAGSGFKKAGIKTDGYTPATPSRDFVLRVPDSVANSIQTEASRIGKKVIGCDVYISGGIYWSYDTGTYHDTQLSLYEGGADSFLVDCSGAQDLNGGNVTSWNYTEKFDSLTTLTTSYSQTSPFTYRSNGIDWEVSARTSMDNYAIDGQGVILKGVSHVQASGLTKGVGSLGFTYRLWGSDSKTSIAVEFFSGNTSLGTVTSESLSAKDATDVTLSVKKAATKFVIKSTEANPRIILDNVRWTNK